MLTLGTRPLTWLRLTMLTVGLLIFGAGCSRKQDGPQRFDVSGTVMYRGAPLEAGRITFVPDLAKENRGPVGYSSIKDGKYDTSWRGGKGAVAGPLVVLISGYDYSGAANEELRPPLFVDYEVTAQIDPEGSRPVFDFEVPDAKTHPRPK